MTIRNRIRILCALAAVTVQALPLNAALSAHYGALPSAAQLQWHELERYALCHFTINTFTD